MRKSKPFKIIKSDMNIEFTLIFASEIGWQSLKNTVNSNTEYQEVSKIKGYRKT